MTNLAAKVKKDLTRPAERLYIIIIDAKAPRKRALISNSSR